MKRHQYRRYLGPLSDQEYTYRQTHGGREDFAGSSWGRSGDFGHQEQFHESDSYERVKRPPSELGMMARRESIESEERPQEYSRSRFAEPYTGGQFARSQYGIGAQFSQDWINHFGKGPKDYIRSDERIREDACEALYRNPVVDASEIEVSVQDGCIRLSGSVRDRQMKREAEICIEHLLGVRDVKNDLELRAENQGH